MGTIHKTSCVLCAQNCGLEVIQINLLRQGTAIALQQRGCIGIFLAWPAELKNHSRMAGFWWSSPPRVLEINCRRWARDLAWRPSHEDMIGQGEIIPQSLHGLENEHLRRTMKGVSHE